MRARRAVWLLLGAVSVLALVVGTGGFSTAAVDRGVSIAVADHDRALVSVWDPGGASAEPPRYQGEDPVTPEGTRVKLVVVENRFDAGPIDLRVTERAASPVSVDGSYEGLASGEVAPVVADVDCDGHHGRTEVPLTVHATAVNGEFESEIRYDASVVCPDPTPTPAPEGTSG
jgi:hypothetical protein